MTGVQTCALPIYAPPAALRVVEIDAGARRRLEQKFPGVCCFDSAKAAIRTGDVVLLAVKPQQMRVALATDLGYLPENVKHYLRGCHAMIVESNHDLEMLRTGPYPWHLKQRVMGRTGHLSNAALCEFLCSEEYDGEAQTVILAHLSEQNNHPQIARMEASGALERRSREGTRLVISSQHEISELFEF